MSASPDTPDPAADHRAPMFWLPPHGSGNGISAAAWAEIADLTEGELPRVFRALTEAHIAGYVATVRAGTGRPTYRLWVDSMHYRGAEDVLMEVLRGDRHG